MKNKKAKQMICDVLNSKYELGSGGRFVWMENDLTPCLICFETANFMWPKHTVKSLTANQLRVR